MQIYDMYKVKIFKVNIPVQKLSRYLHSETKSLPKYRRGIKIKKKLLPLYSQSFINYTYRISSKSEHFSLRPLIGLITLISP